jgi:hypothetical protein
MNTAHVKYKKEVIPVTKWTTGNISKSFRIYLSNISAKE